MNPDERIAVFKNMAEADPDNELAHFSLGKLYFEKKDLDAAEKSLRRTLELSPHHTQAHKLLGEALLALDKKDEAVEILSAGVLVAHERGEYMPRNQMQEILKAQGVEPPEIKTEKPSETDGDAGDDVFRCRRCMKYGTRLGEPPLRGATGQKIYDTICQSCWKEWIAMSIKVINEYRLNLGTPQADEIFENHMREFLGL